MRKGADLRRILSFGVALTPALAVGGEVKSADKVLSVGEIRAVPA